MKRRVLATFLGITLAATSLVGCSQGSAETEKDSKPETKTEAPAKTQAGVKETADNGSQPALEYVEMDWYTAYDVERPDFELVEEKLNEYLLEKLNLKLDIHWISSSEFSEKMRPMLQAGEEIGIVNLRSDYFNDAKQGLYYPIDELWDEYGVATRALFSEDVWSSITVDDHVYIVPPVKDNCYVMGYVYNEDLANELGIDMENTGWNGLRDSEELLIQALQKRDELHPEWKGMPLLSGLVNWGQISPYVFSTETFISQFYAVCNIPGLEKTGGYDVDTVYNLFETEEYKEFCLMMQRLVEAGVCPYDNTLYTNLTAEPSTLMDISWGYTWIDENLWGTGATTKLKVFDNLWSDASCYAGLGIAIPANCPNPERAMMFIDLLNSDEYVATLLRFGIEGEHYLIDANGKMTLEGSPRNSDTSNPGYLMWYGPYFGNLTITKVPESYGGPNNELFSRMLEYNNSAKLAAHIGFVVDTDPIVNEIAACNNVVEEFNTNLISGRYESQDAVVAAITEFNEKLEANGLNKILEEIQTQLDVWKS